MKPTTGITDAFQIQSKIEEIDRKIDELLHLKLALRSRVIEAATGRTHHSHAVDAVDPAPLSSPWTLVWKPNRNRLTLSPYASDDESPIPLSNSFTLLMDYPQEPNDHTQASTVVSNRRSVSFSSPISQRQRSAQNTMTVLNSDHVNVNMNVVAAAAHTSLY